MKNEYALILDQLTSMRKLRVAMSSPVMLLKMELMLLYFNFSISLHLAIPSAVSFKTESSSYTLTVRYPESL